MPGIITPAIMCATTIGTGVAFDRGLPQAAIKNGLMRSNLLVGASNPQANGTPAHFHRITIAIEFNEVSTGIGTHLRSLLTNCFHLARGRELQSVPASQTIGKIKVTVPSIDNLKPFKLELPFNLANKSGVITKKDWKIFVQALETLEAESYLSGQEILGLYAFLFHLELSGHHRSHVVGVSLHGIIASTVNQFINKHSSTHPEWNQLRNYFLQRPRDRLEISELDDEGFVLIGEPELTLDNLGFADQRQGFGNLRLANEVQGRR